MHICTNILLFVNTHEQAPRPYAQLNEAVAILAGWKRKEEEQLEKRVRGSFVVLDLSQSALCTTISIHCFQFWYIYMLNVPQKFV